MDGICSGDMDGICSGDMDNICSGDMDNIWSCFCSGVGFDDRRTSLILKRPNGGLVLSTNTRFFPIVKPLHGQIQPQSWAWGTDVKLTSPQLARQTVFEKYDASECIYKWVGELFCGTSCAILCSCCKSNI